MIWLNLKKYFNKILSDLTPIHFCLNHLRIAPNYITKQNDNCINTQKSTAWQLSKFNNSDATLYKTSFLLTPH